MKTKKEFVVYVGGQDNTGLKDIEPVKNDYAFDFEFTRTAQGVFECANFDKTKHVFLAIINETNSYFKWGEEEKFISLNGFDLNDYVFENGGFITISSWEEEELTADELSELSHAKSILFGSGSEKLIQKAHNL